MNFRIRRHTEWFRVRQNQFQSTKWKGSNWPPIAFNLGKICQDVLRERKKPISGIVAHVLGFVSVSSSFSLSDKLSSFSEDSSSSPRTFRSDAIIAKIFAVDIFVYMCVGVNYYSCCFRKKNCWYCQSLWVEWLGQPSSCYQEYFWYVKQYLYTTKAKCRHQNRWWLKVKIILKRHPFISIFRTPWHFCCPWLWPEKQVPGRTSPPLWKTSFWINSTFTCSAMNVWHIHEKEYKLGNPRQILAGIHQRKNRTEADPRLWQLVHNCHQG